GWATYGQPTWGFVKFGHTRPDTSNSGLLTILLITYDYFDKSSGLSEQDVLSDDYNRWLQGLAREVEVGNSTGTFMEQLIAFGPSKFDMVAVYEATAIAQVGNAAGRYGALGIYYPPATVSSDHPFCVLAAPWVTAEKAEAAQKFVDFLLSRPVQEQALELGFRPADATISLTGGNTPFDKLAQNGIQTNLPPEVEVPPGNILLALIRAWERSSR
ncbi:MAG: extracellular solute-binding protein, partial [Anaerolineae bacterium]|nr:extracellular solute-binding protein [Anaerolineae bacterium]